MSELVKCPHCELSFKKGGIHHHIQRKHEGKVINYVQAFKGKKMPKELTVNYGKGKRGKFGVFKLSEETKKKCSESALKSKHRRLLRSMRPYIKTDGTTVILDSSWEEMVAKRLDFLEIEWYRPSSMKWVDQTGKDRNYFPDFYLPKYDLYLDPKNPFAFKVQIEKINYIEHNYSNVIFLRTEEECNNFCPW